MQPLLSPAGQAGDLWGDFFDQLPRIADNVHCFVAACEARGDREVAAGKVPSAGKQLQQRLVGAPAFRRCGHRSFYNTSALRHPDREQTIGLSPRRQSDRNAQAVMRQF